MWLRNQTSLADFIFEGLFDDFPTHLFLFCLTMVVYLFALGGNTLTILLICVDHGLHTPMYFLLSQLSLMGLMHVCTTIPKMATNYLSGTKSVSFLGCATQHFLYLSLGGAECLLLALMSYDRYVAICQPLHYKVLMSRKVALMMALTSWLGASLNSLIHKVILILFPFCGTQKIHHFYCEYPAVVKLVFVNVTVYVSTVFISTIILLLLPIILVSTFYGFILHSVFEMHSSRFKRNIFATCSSHLIVLSLWFGACIFSYVRLRSQHTPLQDKVGSVFYRIITPTLNLLIYTLWNTNVAKALRRVAETSPSLHRWHYQGDDCMACEDLDRYVGGGSQPIRPSPLPGARKLGAGPALGPPNSRGTAIYTGRGVTDYDIIRIGDASS
ncbi:olfactory receptor 2AE1-like [Ictidomys tridecemlineatus]|uniref:olfactory receptor 2AE1-like n=1 Tax=Ictidomys tridecemlineatus TaxID=43179 RepID=UPI00038BFD2C|nr:olfactory receptor 2AE1-like [Ictidomys tridecemlineatus]KAG3259968.1 olfactory receptor 2AE1-like [Ictidomys tridecemlineatus]